jgi:hypothetical protein
MDTVLRKYAHFVSLTGPFRSFTRRPEEGDVRRKLIKIRAVKHSTIESDNGKGLTS